MNTPDIWVVVSSYGGPPDCTKDDGTRYGPIVWETDADGATREAAMKRAARIEKQHGACRIARLVFDDEAPSAPTT